MGRALQVAVREFNPNTDLASVEDLERRCEVGCLLVDLMGDPLARVRRSPAFHMLVAEIDDESRTIVGMIRGTIKTVARGKNVSPNSKDDDVSVKHSPVWTKVAYVSGLRVCPSHRRMGIALKLMEKLEEWFKQNGAAYAYMATEGDNHASVKLFTEKCRYSKFRTPSFLVNPVFHHSLHVPRRHITIIQLPHKEAESFYNCHFSNTEFFPDDIGSVLRNKLSIGTFLAVARDANAPPQEAHSQPVGIHAPSSKVHVDAREANAPPSAWWEGSDLSVSAPPESWAVLSVWNCKDVYQLQVQGASCRARALAKASRILDKTLPFLRIPSFPDLFRPFGMHFLYGIGGEGPRAVEMVAALCAHAHNLAKKSGCAVVAAEVASLEPLRAGIPHWKALSPEDLWCIKRLGNDGGDDVEACDWATSPPPLSVFVDPREL